MTARLIVITLIRNTFVLLGLLCIALQVSVKASASSEIDTARQKELRYMVQQDCGSCHGMTLKGGLGPSLLPERIAALPDQYLFDAIFHGREGAPMPPWAPILTTAEIHWIVQQLKAGQLGQTPNKSHATTNSNSNINDNR